MCPLTKKEGLETIETAYTTKLLGAEDLIARYCADPFILTAMTEASAAAAQKKRVHLKELCGSLDAVFAAAYIQEKGGSHLFVLHDKEEAAYFNHDLQNLLPQRETLFFPTTYKRPYQFLEVENANILQRAEVLNNISQRKSSKQPNILVVSYPEALTEKVISQRSLMENTFTIATGEQLDTAFLTEFLFEYGFERTDFVYEAGQFAVRGGIIDVFSFANELPFRLELFGDEVESIRVFDPLTQLSVDEKKQVAIIPNIQGRLIREAREHFLEFIPADTCVWCKDLQLVTDTIGLNFQKAEAGFKEILEASGGTQVVKSPEDLFETPAAFTGLLEKFPLFEFGNRFCTEAAYEYRFGSSPQPSFNKDFKLLAETLRQNQATGLQNIIASGSAKQLDRLKLIFEQLDTHLGFGELGISLRQGFVHRQVHLACYTDHQLFERFHRYKEKPRFSKNKGITLKELRSLNIGDFIVHIDHGIGRFGGMEKIQVSGREQEAIRLIYRDDDLLYISVHSLHKISKYAGKDGGVPQVTKLGSAEWDNKKKKVKKRVKDIAKELISLYAKRKAAPGYAFTPDSYLQAELESSFIYEDTPDQAKATQDVKDDMEQAHPMDRLVCGDVGFGKTEVAIRAAFKAVCDSKQAAVLVPTTILAMQHYRTFKERLAQLPCRVEYINRFKSAKEIKETLKDLAEGKVDILIGTHRITSKDVKFKNLGLLVIDEEQKFGVKTKDRLKELRVNVDVLTLTATPIPRTLHFSLMGARDLSVIATPPPNRQPVTTELHVYSEELLRDAVSKELKRGGQVFFVHNRVSDIESQASKIIDLVPDAKVAYAHGQMEGSKLEKIMMKFIEGDYDVLVSTNIIESGLDIPNANTIIINRAHTFGLSDLHQMRGRVGRSNRKAYCYLLTPPVSLMSGDARKRLSALEEFSDLGDGFRVAMRDLDIRGAGNLLGGEQSGFISDLGFDMYNKVLEDAVQELKEEEFKELFAQHETPGEQGFKKTECNIETDLELLIPENYVANISERLSLYIQADEVKDEAGLEKFKNSLTDRFGPLPEPVADLLKTVRLRWKAEKLGFERLVLKNGSLKAYLVNEENAAYYQSPVFGLILAFVKKHPRACRLKEANKRLVFTVEDIPSVEEAIKCLAEISGESI